MNSYYRKTSREKEHIREESIQKQAEKKQSDLRTEPNMADQEEEHEIMVEEAPVEKVEVDPSTLTPTSPEVISR